ncbi:hypothetical protein N8083_01955 [Candidatus Pacebacteria bacterium]|nr:hypothetical protein [Candidatus Paceibacterota bacterium]
MARTHIAKNGSPIPAHQAVINANTLKAISTKNAPRNITVERSKRPRHRDESHLTTDQAYSEKYRKGLGEELLNPRATKKTKEETETRARETAQTPRKEQPPVSAKRIAKNRKRLMKFKAKGHGTKGIAKVAKVVRAAYMIGAVCGVLYVAQIFFWILMIVGYGLEANALSAGDLSGGNIITRTAASILGTLIPGKHVFMVGWIVSSVLGWFQLFIALGILYFNRINAFSGDGLKNFGWTFAIYGMPLGLIPWVAVWVFYVARHTVKK